MELFKVMCYTNVSFVKYPNFRYEGGDIYAYNGQDPDYWSYFKACDLIKGIDSEFDVRVVKIWWKDKGGSLDDDLKPFRDDGDAYELVVFAFGNNCEVEIYTESKPLIGDNIFIDKVNEKMMGKKYDEEVVNSSESSDESVNVIYFNDSKEGRMNEFDVGMDGGQPRSTHVGNSDSKTEPPNKSFITQEMGREHIIEEDYMDDKLDSGEYDESCDDRPSVIIFNEEDALSKDFTFKF